MEVELDAFSGRPNPKWVLSEEKTSELLGKLASLPPVGIAPPIPDLGFRGFVLRSGDRTVRLYRGYVIEESGRKRVYRDTSGAQAELESDARRRGFEAIFASSSQ